MGYSSSLSEVLIPYDEDFVKVFLLKFTLTSSSPEYSESITIKITDSVNTAVAFETTQSKNNKELYFYFTLDAFTGFSTISEVTVRRNSEVLLFVDDFNVLSFDGLTSYDELNSYLQGDSTWLASLEL